MIETLILWRDTLTIWREDMWWKIVAWNCRRRGHPAGPVYYNPSGYEPDYSCKNCGEELG